MQFRFLKCEQFQVYRHMTQCTDRVTIDYQIEKNKKNGLIIVLMDFICYKDVFYL